MSHLLELFNACCQGYKELPKEWVDAEVVSIYKRKGATDNHSNCRGIILLDTIGRLYASIIYGRLKTRAYCDLPQTQFGFREGYSTEQTILTVRTLIQISDINLYLSEKCA